MMTVQPPERPAPVCLACSLAYGRAQNADAAARRLGCAAAALGRLLEEHGATLLTGGGSCRSCSRTALRRRRDRGRASATSRAGPCFDDSRQAPRRHGAGGGVGRAVRSGRRCLARRRPHLRHALLRHDRAADVAPGRSVAPVASGTAALGRPRCSAWAEFERRPSSSTTRPAVVCPTVADPDRAPEGSTAQVIGFQPYELAEGGPGAGRSVKEEVSAGTSPSSAATRPNLTDETILAPVIKCPLDLEEHEPAQLARLLPRRRHRPGAVGPAAAGRRLGPAPRLPIAGLYQTGRPRARARPVLGRRPAERRRRSSSTIWGCRSRR